VIRVLVLDGMPAQREHLCQLLRAQPDMEVVGSASTCQEAMALIGRWQPGIALVSHQPPHLDALQVTRCMMEICPLPIVIISASDNPAGDISPHAAIEAGALAVMPRPSPDAAPIALDSRDLWQTMRVMAEVKVVRRWPKNNLSAQPTDVPAVPVNRIKIVAIGASTGGPVALATLLGALPRNFFVPIVIVQHMSSGFIRGLIEWLAPSLSLPIEMAVQDQYLRAGHVYMAPDDTHLRVTHNQRIQLVAGPPDNGVRPSVAQLFQSVAEVYGPNAVGVLLTGMGRDGAAELLQLRQQGALTFAQDKNSSVVHGMPGEAIKLGAAQHILPPDKIAVALRALSNAGQAGG
jgi:two-component system chemotaxis response regulator CheB